MVMSQIPALFRPFKGEQFENKVPPVEKIPRLLNDNKKRESYEQKKNDVKSTAALLRISEEGKNKAST